MPWNLDIVPTSFETLQVVCTGDCTIKSGTPTTDAIVDEFRPNLTLSFDTTALGEWDSTFLTFLLKLEECCAHNQMRMEREGLPVGVQKM
ncbi:TPA: hypothetical protein DDW35_11095, partial [Candidatus Sumerlaeota bacterium]|nr:hypothetical protein [Candidatus Sumerlaeota bacterium]